MAEKSNMAAGFVFVINLPICVCFCHVNTFWKRFAIVFRPKLSKIKILFQDGGNFQNGDHQF
jgi:hypothetical protein